MVATTGWGTWTYTVMAEWSVTILPKLLALVLFLGTTPPYSLSFPSQDFASTKPMCPLFSTPHNVHCSHLRRKTGILPWSQELVLSLKDHIDSLLAWSQFPLNRASVSIHCGPLRIPTTGCQVPPSWQGKERGRDLLGPQQMGQVPGLSGAVKTLVSTEPVHAVDRSRKPSLHSANSRDPLLPADRAGSCCSSHLLFFQASTFSSVKWGQHVTCILHQNVCAVGTAWVHPSYKTGRLLG